MMGAVGYLPHLEKVPISSGTALLWYQAGGWRGEMAVREYGRDGYSTTTSTRWTMLFPSPWLFQG